MRRFPVSGLERCPACHPERREGSGEPAAQILRGAQDDIYYLGVPTFFPPKIPAKKRAFRDARAS